MRRVENKPRDVASTPWPIHTGSLTASACTAEVSGKACVDVTSESEKDVNVAERLDIVVATEVQNVVKPESSEMD